MYNDDAHRLRKATLKSKSGVREIAAKTGIAPSTLYSFLNGQTTSMSFEKMERLRKLVGPHESPAMIKVKADNSLIRAAILDQQMPRVELAKKAGVAYGDLLRFSMGLTKTLDYPSLGKLAKVLLPGEQL